MTITTEDIRRVFRKTWVSTTEDGFSVVHPCAEKQDDSEAYNDIPKEEFGLFKEICRECDAFRVRYEDGKSAGLQFRIKGIQDPGMVFPPLKREITAAELERMNRELDNYKLPPEADIDWLIERVTGKSEPYEFRSRVKWPGFLAKAEELADALPDFSLDVSQPDHTGIGYVAFRGPMDDDSDGFSIVISGKVKEKFLELLDMTYVFEIVFCCYKDFSSIDFLFTA